MQFTWSVACLPIQATLLQTDLTADQVKAHVLHLPQNWVLISSMLSCQLEDHLSVLQVHMAHRHAFDQHPPALTSRNANLSSLQAWNQIFSGCKKLLVTKERECNSLAATQVTPELVAAPLKYIKNETGCMDREAIVSPALINGYSTGCAGLNPVEDMGLHIWRPLHDMHD